MWCPERRALGSCLPRGNYRGVKTGVVGAREGGWLSAVTGERPGARGAEDEVTWQAGCADVLCLLECHRQRERKPPYVEGTLPFV